MCGWWVGNGDPSDQIMNWLLLDTVVVRDDVGSNFRQDAEPSRRISCAKDKPNGDDEPVAPGVCEICGDVYVVVPPV